MCKETCDMGLYLGVLDFVGVCRWGAGGCRRSEGDGRTLKVL